MEVVVCRELSEKENRWLTALREGVEGRRIMALAEEIRRRDKAPEAGVYLEAVMNANAEELKEAGRMTRKLEQTLEEMGILPRWREKMKMAERQMEKAERRTEQAQRRIEQAQRETKQAQRETKQAERKIEKAERQTEQAQRETKQAQRRTEETQRLAEEDRRRLEESARLLRQCGVSIDAIVKTTGLSRKTVREL